MTTHELRLGFWRNVAGTIISLLICLIGVKYDTLLSVLGGLSVGIGIVSIHIGLKELRKRKEKIWP